MVYQVKGDKFAWAAEQDNVRKAIRGTGVVNYSGYLVSNSYDSDLNVCVTGGRAIIQGTAIELKEVLYENDFVFTPETQSAVSLDTVIYHSSPNSLKWIYTDDGATQYDNRITMDIDSSLKDWSKKNTIRFYFYPAATLENTIYFSLTNNGTEYAIGSILPGDVTPSTWNVIEFDLPTYRDQVEDIFFYVDGNQWSTATHTFYIDDIEVYTKLDIVAPTTVDYGRIDLVCVDKLGDIYIKTGTEVNLNTDTPKPEDIDLDELGLALVSVEYGDTSFIASDIVDIRSPLSENEYVEGVFPKSDGDNIKYSSEINAMVKSVRSYTIGNENNLFFNGINKYNLNDGVFFESYETDIAASTTNLTHSTILNEYYSITPGAFELISNTYYSEDDCEKCFSFIDFSFYKVLEEATIESTATNAPIGDPPYGEDTDDGAIDLVDIKSIFLNFYINADSGTDDNDGSNIGRLRISDGAGNYINIFSISSSRYIHQTAKGYLKLYNDVANKKLIGYACYELYYENNNSNSDNEIQYYRNHFISLSVDYSTFNTGNLYINTYAFSRSGSTQTRIYGYRAYKQNPSSAATTKVSSDGGSTWEEVYNGAMVNVTAGNQFKAKISGTLAAGEGISIKRVIIKPEA